MARQLAERLDTLVDADTSRLIEEFKDIHPPPRNRLALHRRRQKHLLRQAADVAAWVQQRRFASCRPVRHSPLRGALMY
jgi:hypothetical protein